MHVKLIQNVKSSECLGLLGTTFELPVHTHMLSLSLSLSLSHTHIHIHKYPDSSFILVLLFVSHMYLSFAATTYQNTQGTQGENDPNNTTVGSLF